MSIQLPLFSRIITLSWLQTNPSPGWFSGWTLCFIFSWSVGLPGRAHKMEAIVWDCQSCCKRDPFKVKHLAIVCYAVTHGPSPTRSFGPNPSTALLREKMGEEKVIKDWGRFAGINLDSSELKLRNVTCKPESYRKLHGTSKSFSFLLLILRLCPWEFIFNL